MWTFAGLLVVAGVLAYWGKRAVRALIVLTALIEVGLNRGAKIRGEPKVSDDVDTAKLF